VSAEERAAPKNTRRDREAVAARESEEAWRREKLAAENSVSCTAYAPRVTLSGTWVPKLSTNAAYACCTAGAADRGGSDCRPSRMSWDRCQV
jgi:hypothetical protein